MTKYEHHGNFIPIKVKTAVATLVIDMKPLKRKFTKRQAKLDQLIDKSRSSDPTHNGKHDAVNNTRNRE